ncbi:hypothetical protein HDU98_000715 [Podochytrium sp. JEL0797]|nr:hypothetical protein HDU98_000715 [Podochytrium sp. JEL0797]
MENAANDGRPTPLDETLQDSPVTRPPRRGTVQSEPAPKQNTEDVMMKSSLPRLTSQPVSQSRPADIDSVADFRRPSNVSGTDASNYHTAFDTVSTVASDMGSTEIKNVAWENLVQKVFKSLPYNEPLFIGEHILHQGKMYLTPNFFCFHANIFGYLTTFEFPIQDILLIERAKTALIIPNAIIISTAFKSYFFTSFLNRENTFVNMEHLIARYRESHQNRNWKPSQSMYSTASIADKPDTQFDEEDDSPSDEQTPALSRLETAHSTHQRPQQPQPQQPQQQQQQKRKPTQDSEAEMKRAHTLPIGAPSSVASSRPAQQVETFSRGLAGLSIMILAICLCMLLALGSTIVLWKIKSVVGRLEKIASLL